MSGLVALGIIAVGVFLVIPGALVLAYALGRGLESWWDKPWAGQQPWGNITWKGEPWQR